MKSSSSHTQVKNSRTARHTLTSKQNTPTRSKLNLNQDYSVNTTALQQQSRTMRAQTAATQMKSTGNMPVGNGFNQTVKYNRGGLFDATAQQSPLRGTLFRSPSSGMPTYWHESVGPQFDGAQSVFSVKHVTGQLNKEPARISYDTIARLMTKPAHRESRTKFEPLNEKCQKEKRNTTQTAEDKYQRDNVPWITSLRPLDPHLSQKALKTAKDAKKQKKDEEESEKERLVKQEMAVPPQFYEEDMEKWSRKFQTARENRNQQKAMIKSLGCFKPFGTKNTNTATTTSKHQRRNSRQSTNTFTGVDFEYSGNTNNVNHLIKSTKQANRHVSQLNFELNLRTYRNQTKFVGQTAWQYPVAHDYYDPVGLDKPTFGHSHQLGKGTSKVSMLKDLEAQKASDQPRRNLGNYMSTDPSAKKYNDKYRIKNVSELKQLLCKGTNQPTLEWQTGLRPNLGSNSAWSIKPSKKTSKAGGSRELRRQCYCPTR